MKFQANKFTKSSVFFNFKYPFGIFFLFFILSSFFSFVNGIFHLFEKTSIEYNRTLPSPIVELWIVIFKKIFKNLTKTLWKNYWYLSIFIIDANSPYEASRMLIRRYEDSCCVSCVVCRFDLLSEIGDYFRKTKGITLSHYLGN